MTDIAGRERAMELDVFALALALDEVVSPALKRANIVVAPESMAAQIKLVYARLIGAKPKREAPCGRCGSDWHYTDECEATR